MATILPSIVFILVLIVFLAADLVSRDLLNPDLYTNSFEEGVNNNCIYPELLVDPATVEASKLLTDLDLTLSAG